MIKPKKNMSSWAKQQQAKWFEFARLIKFRDTHGVFGLCISCNKPVNYGTSNCHAGHYIKATFTAIKYDERNVNMQCYHCNMHLESNHVGYTRGMIKKYGQKVIDQLEMSMHNSAERDESLDRLMTQKYKADYEELKQMYQPKFRL